jgi:uncharacterized repeat protein (TIGR01451 family)
MKKQLLVVAVLALLLIPMGAMAKPLVSVSITAEKEMKVVKDGQKNTKKVAATKIEPGDVIFYTLNYINSGNEPATKVVLDDPIPMGTVYIPGSASGEGAEITFSIDGGKSFKKPSLLTYEVKLPSGKTEKRTASAEEYTHIRWLIEKIEPNKKGTVSFQVRIKR